MSPRQALRQVKGTLQKRRERSGPKELGKRFKELMMESEALFLFQIFLSSPRPTLSLMLFPSNNVWSPLADKSEWGLRDSGCRGTLLVFRGQCKQQALDVFQSKKPWELLCWSREKQQKPRHQFISTPVFQSVQRCPNYALNVFCNPHSLRSFLLFPF